MPIYVEIALPFLLGVALVALYIVADLWGTFHLPPSPPPPKPNPDDTCGAVHSRDAIVLLMEESELARKR